MGEENPEFTQVRDSGLDVDLKIITSSLGEQGSLLFGGHCE